MNTIGCALPKACGKTVTAFIVCEMLKAFPGQSTIQNSKYCWTDFHTRKEVNCLLPMPLAKFLLVSDSRRRFQIAWKPVRNSEQYCILIHYSVCTLHRSSFLFYRPCSRELRLCIHCPEPGIASMSWRWFLIGCITLLNPLAQADKGQKLKT